MSSCVLALKKVTITYADARFYLLLGSFMHQKDQHALLDIVYSAEKIIKYVEGVSQGRFMEDEQLQDAVIRRLLVV